MPVLAFTPDAHATRENPEIERSATSSDRLPKQARYRTAPHPGANACNLATARQRSYQVA